MAKDSAQTETFIFDNVDEESDVATDEPGNTIIEGTGEAGKPVAIDELVIEKARNYQVEMLEESLRRNIIVAVSAVQLAASFFAMQSLMRNIDGYGIGENTHVRNSPRSGWTMCLILG